ncbi:hypothetical protein EDF51_1301 [Curtobacterium sp. PhB25]|uniref:hypothetical protein n=1 Tax=Curtobacterium sp. PhB25 TaxID=2485205 RepID=UPI0010659DDC|nr:hypothetical protein [Curtobacterium sp. PhB25]TDW63448.1 hypothetical protein EDF51_1301 [Curtobacterium sp. PhB25]
MHWQEVVDVGRSDAAAHRDRAVLERAGAARCTEEARTATDLDSELLWLMRALQQRSAAASNEIASEISDRIADHAERVLHAQQ